MEKNYYSQDLFKKKSWGEKQDRERKPEENNCIYKQENNANFSNIYNSVTN